MKPAQIPFQFVGNDLALDLVNTLVMDGDEIVDLIPSVDRFLQWLRQSETVQTCADWTDAELKALHGLRAAIRDLLDAALAGSPPKQDAVDRINQHLSDYDTNEILSFTDSAYQYSTREQRLDPSMVLGLLAKHAADVLTVVPHDRLKNCAHPKCVLVFKDTSKSGRRRWCSMETCGNRSKVSAHRANAS